MPPSTRATAPTVDQDIAPGTSSPGDGFYNTSVRLDNRPREGAALNTPGPGANSPMRSELAHLMEEVPGGPNSGRRASSNPEVEGRHLPLGTDEAQAADFLREGGWGIITGAGGERQRAGMTAHRGVTSSDEYVDADALRPLVEAALGFTYDEVRSVYRQGRLSNEQRELRGSIDARLLALSRSGGNLTELGRALGFYVDEYGNCDVVKAAVARAKTEEDA